MRRSANKQRSIHRAMNETPNTRTAELFDAMAAAYETWAEPLSARLAQVALKRTSVRAGDCMLDIGAGTGALAHQAAAEPLVGPSRKGYDEFTAYAERF